MYLKNRNLQSKKQNQSNRAIFLLFSKFYLLAHNFYHNVFQYDRYWKDLNFRISLIFKKYKYVYYLWPNQIYAVNNSLSVQLFKYTDFPIL